jgi:cytochrome c oxidase cbb3-type subunit 3
MSRRRDELLDHDVDGIREFDNDLPRWWLYGFYVTIAFALVYVVNFHVLSTPLVGARSVVEEYEADVRAHPRPGPATPEPGTTPATLVALVDPEALAEGRAIYESQTHPCAACHRPDLGGLVGPNLTDDQWLHGCTIGQIVESIRTGFPMQGMVPFGGGPALSDEKLLELGSYILSKRGSQPPAPKPPDVARDRPCPPGS